MTRRCHYIRKEIRLEEELYLQAEIVLMNGNPHIGEFSRIVNDLLRNHLKQIAQLPKGTDHV